MLKGFKIVPRNIRKNDVQKKGYPREWFKEPVERYLPDRELKAPNDDGGEEGGPVFEEPF